MKQLLISLLGNMTIDINGAWTITIIRWHWVPAEIIRVHVALETLGLLHHQMHVD